MYPGLQENQQRQIAGQVLDFVARYAGSIALAVSAP
jgi:hypothetical protein